MTRLKSDVHGRCLFILPALAVLLCLPRIAAADGGKIESKPLAEPARPPGGATLMRLLPPAETGVDMVIPIDGNHPLRRAYHSSSACAAVAIGDLDLDGRPDVYAGNGPGDNCLYLQRDSLRFENVAPALGVTGGEAAWGVGVSLVDFDNDGDLDIYVCNYDYPNQLYVNLLIDHGVRGKELKFEERAATLGLDATEGSVVSAFADYDRDGDLDMYLLTHQIYREGGRPMEPIRIFEQGGRFTVEDKWKRWYDVEQDKRGDNGEFLYTEAGRPDYLFRNDGEAGFTNVTAAAGITTERHWGNSSTWWDYNRDGWPDLYVGNDFKSPDFLYRNNGDGTFTEVSKGLFRHTTWFSMGAVQSDFNNDGLVDFVIADMMPRTHYMQKASMASMASRQEELVNVDGVNQIMRNTFHINTGTNHFMEGAWMADIAHTEWTWAIRGADFDNDGLSDLFFCNGVPRQFNHSDLPPINHQTLVGKTHWDHYEHTTERREQNMAFHNLGDFQFEDVSEKWGLAHVGMSYGASLGDLDGDGRLELLTSNLADPLSVYWNAGDSGNRVVVELRGKQSNPRGVGSTLTAVTPDGARQTRQFFPYGGFLDADEPLVHFGLGKNETIAELRVDWPSGQVQVFKNLEVNRRHIITEPDEPAAKGAPVTSEAPKNPWFVASPALAGFRHVEREYDDFARQPLLPFKLSQLGPGQAWGDIDGDGDADLFLGGAAGQPGQLFENRTEPGSGEIVLQPLPAPLLSIDAEHEDMGATFVDVDADGDLDLYVGSGSVECDPGADLLRDRLYLNDGKGEFTRAAEGTLPDSRESTGAVAAADFDRDGDLDLFVGARSIPGDYPLSPRSVLLRNEGGKFADITATIAPRLAECGMVTSALWSDADNDGWSDLFVTTDLGPIRLFKNREGKLAEATEEAGLAGKGLATLGWWAGIDGRDIDNDGDIDYVATNLGRNTLYRASLEFPELTFYGDFDESGKSHIVQARFVVEHGKKSCYPRATFVDAARAMPYIADVMQTFDNYAKRDIFGIYDTQKLESALQIKTNCMDSSVLINDGTGKFAFVPLPHLAQMSPGFGVVLRDIDLDGRVDCYLVQNHFTPPDEIGEMASGLSLLLRGTGDAARPFEPVWPAETGLEVPGDAKSLATADLNADGYEDLVVGVNNAEPVIFVNAAAANRDTRPFTVQLKGKAGNPSAVGARVTVKAGDLAPQTAEVGGGGSYLAQSTGALTFAVPKESGSEITVEIRWPDGESDTSTVAAGSRNAVLERK
ncbi:MAG: VCBS repeat-containing protein [Akkermansiaceae bacterium]|nr:VCBS repeat-containing protein [Akkermansiaceae bacterium]